jgi:hypothetical protein
VHDGGAGGGEHVDEVGKGPGSEQHDVGAGASGGRLVLAAEHSDEDGDEGVDGEGGERVLGADGEHLAELHEGLELARLVAVGLQAGEDPLEVCGGGRGGGGGGGGEEVVEAGAEPAEECFIAEVALSYR